MVLSRAPGPPSTDVRFDRAARAFGAPRFRALFRAWLEHGEPVLDATVSPVLADAIGRGSGRLESHVLPHRICISSPWWARPEAARTREKGKKGGKTPWGSLFPLAMGGFDAGIAVSTSRGLVARRRVLVERLTVVRARAVGLEGRRAASCAARDSRDRTAAGT